MSVLIVSFVVAALTADGASVYRENCAACHGKEGHGDGPTAPELKYKPRDFREGKFAFGNTPGAMVKTVMSGIPGELQARMPAFKSVLAAEEIDAVVQYVRTMMPVEPAPTPTDMKLEPRDGALMVRGILPSLEKDGPPIARGLLIGLPSGFSFEYGTKPVRLLAVRRGEFVSRTDWEERGGRPLTPLGSVVFAPVQPSEWAPFVVNEGGEGPNAKLRPLTAKLCSTSTKGGIAELAYDLVDPDGMTRAHVKERPRDVVVSDGSGILQDFEFTAARPATIYCSFTSENDPSLPLPHPRSPSTKTFGSLGDHYLEQCGLWDETKWWVTRPNGNQTLAVRFEAAHSQGESFHSNEGRDTIDSIVTADATPTTLRRIVIARGPTTIEQLEKMTAETKELH
jgi:cytochrome c553